MPAVAVILPVRNARAYLPAAIDSICGQSFADIELLVVDGGSTDGSREIAAARAARDRRVRLVESEAKDLVASLELGRRSTPARFIARMDADDISHPRRLAWQHRFLCTHPDIVAVGGQIELIDAAGRWRGRGRFPLTPHACRAQLRRSAPFCHPAVMMRADALETVGGYRAIAYPAEDYDLWLRLADAGGLANLTETVLLYRRHGGAGTVLQAHGNAVSVALVATAKRMANPGSNATEIIAGIDRHTPWDVIEHHLPDADRLAARAAYLTASAVNGGICEGDLAAKLRAAIPALAGRTGEGRADRAALAFAIDRAAYQLVRRRRLGMAALLLAAGLRHLGPDVLADLSASVPRLAYAAVEGAWMPAVHRRRMADWAGQFASAKDSATA